MVGQNTIASTRLRSFIERVESQKAIQKQAREDIGAIMAEAKAEGFLPKAIRYVIKVREEKPHDRQEREALQDLYLHAMGMATEAPLFRFAGLAGIDITARDAVIERMREFVPPNGAGHIDVTFEGRTFRLVRDKDGNVTDSEVIEKPARERSSAPPPTPNRREPPPDVDDAGAEALGRTYARDNRPVIDNPFPFGDARRARFDAGWRAESGNDGMGGNEDD